MPPAEFNFLQFKHQGVYTLYRKKFPRFTVVKIGMPFLSWKIGIGLAVRWNFRLKIASFLLWRKMNFLWECPPHDCIYFTLFYFLYHSLFILERRKSSLMSIFYGIRNHNTKKTDSTVNLLYKQHSFILIFVACSEIVAYKKFFHRFPHGKLILLLVARSLPVMKFLLRIP